MPEAKGEADLSAFPLGGSRVQSTQAGQHSIYDWLRELHEGQQHLTRRIEAVEQALKLTPPPTENELLHRAAILLHNLGVKRGYPDQNAVAWLEQYQRFFTEKPASES